MTKLKCRIKNVGKFGLQLNEVVLPPDVFVDLHDQDVIILSPFKNRSVKIIFEERLVQYE